MKVTDYLVAVMSWMLQCVIRIAAILLGFIVVPIALLFVKLPGPYETTWRYIGLPLFAHPWDNVRDGAMGDKRMWWWREGYPKWMDKLPPRLHAYAKANMWLTIRNSANRMARYYAGIGCPISKCELTYTGDFYVKDAVGLEGFQFVKASGPVFNYYGLYHVIRCPQIGWFKGRSFVGRLGHKIEPRHAGTDWASEEETKRWKGFTFRPYLPQKVD